MHCGRVNPFWVQLGWVKFADHPSKERLMNIEYRRCQSTEATPSPWNGFIVSLCKDCAK